MKSSVTIGLLEDDLFFADMVTVFLEKNRDWKVKHYKDVTSFGKEKEMPDIFIFDYMLSMNDSVPTTKSILKRIVRMFPDIPVIYYTNYKDLDTALDLLKEGASDFLLKDENGMHELANAIEKAISMKKLKKQKEDIEAKIIRVRKRFGSISAAIIILSSLLYLLTG